MVASYRNVFAALMASWLLAIDAGCQTPPFVPPQQNRPESATPSELPPAIDKASATADKTTEANVMREVQKISEQDPHAGKLLLDELSRAEPRMWPQVVQQFRSRQALHEQLLAQPKLRSEQCEKASPDIAVSAPPSEKIGRLRDPRGIRPDPAVEQAFARATPADMPAPLDPAADAGELMAARAPQPMAVEAARPIVTEPQMATAGGAASGKVQQAIYSVSAEPSTPAETQLDWQQHLKLACDDLNERLIDGPRSTAEVHQVVSLRIMNLLTGNTEDALQAIPNVSTEEQDYWSGQIFALATFLDHHRQPDDQRRAAASVVHLDEAVGHLRELGSLTLRNLAFCKNVYGYGAYEPIDNPIFSPGQQVTLYLEVENYHSESTIKGYSTKLGASYELVDDAGERLASGDFPSVEDTCQSRRRDFHIQYGLVLPKTAKPGKYHLKLSMNDRQSDKMGSASIALDIR